jgi:predicted nucleic acid-binding protein
MYVLDTGHCVELLRGNEGVLSKLKSLDEDNDLFIASIALSRNLTLVTHNTHHYERIPNLCLEDWME